MDLSLFGALLSALDPNVIKVCIAVLAALAVLSLIKKAVKLAVFIVVLTVGASFLLPAAKDFQERYSVSVDGQQLILVIDGRQIRLGGGEEVIKDMTLEKNEAGAYILTVVYGEGDDFSFEIPAFMRGVVQAYIRRQPYGSEP